MTQSAKGNSNTVLNSQKDVFQTKNKTFNYPKESLIRNEPITTSVDGRRQRQSSQKGQGIVKTEVLNFPEGHYTPQLMMMSSQSES